MNIDEKVKQALQSDSAEIDQILAEDQGLFDMLFASFKGGMRRWVILINVITLVATVGLFWSGYLFFVAVELQAQVFWGVVMLMLVNVQIALKQWLFMEMNRSSLMREVKRVELAVARLAANMK